MVSSINFLLYENDLFPPVFPLPPISRHSSSAALIRRSSASTVISASRYETDAAAYRDFGIREMPDDDDAVAMGEFLDR